MSLQKRLSSFSPSAARALSASSSKAASPSSLAHPSSGVVQQSSASSAAAAAARGWSRLPRCSLRLVFVSCTVLQVAVACVCVWLLGYEAQLSTVSTLSGQLRNQTMSHMIDQASTLLAQPILAVNEVELNTQQRWLVLQGVAPLQTLDWSADTSYYTTLANIIRHYPGVTATAMQTNQAVLMTAALGFNNSDPDYNPPFLFFINQDLRSNWSWQGWLSSYDQTETRLELYNNVNILTATASFFEQLPAADLSSRIDHPLVDFGYVPPEANNWWSTCFGLAQQIIASNDTASAITVAWSIPLDCVNHDTASTTECMSICKPHINSSPNVTWMAAVAEAASDAGDPRAAFLFEQVQQQQERIDSGLPPLPVVDWVSDVTYDPFAFVVFMQSRLNSFILDHGAAFIATTDGWVLASTLPGPDLDVLIYMPALFEPPDDSWAQYSGNLSLQYPAAMGFVRSLYTNMQSPSWQQNIASVSLQEAAGNYQLSWEQSETINGEEDYVQYAVLGVPATNFSFVLVVYSRQSDYQGDVVYNATLSGVLSAVVIVVSILITLLLTQCLHAPLMTLIVAMQAVLGETRRPAAPAPPLSKPQSPLQKSKDGDKQPAAQPVPVVPSPTLLDPRTSSGESQQMTTGYAPQPSPSSSAYSAGLLPHPSQSLHGSSSPGGAGWLRPLQIARTSSSSSAQSPLHSSGYAAFLSPQAADRDGTMDSQRSTATTGSSAAIEQLRWQPSVYTKFIPQADQQLQQRQQPALTASAAAASSTTYEFSPAADSQEAALAVSVPARSGAAAAHTVQFGAASGAEVSRTGRVSSNSRSDVDDASSYELDLLLQKWQRTMQSQGVQLPAEWETELQEDSARLRELRIGLEEAKRRYRSKRRRSPQAATQPSASAWSSDDEKDEEDDQSVFTPSRELWWPLQRLALLLHRLRPSASSSPSAGNRSEHSRSHASDSASTASSSSHPPSCSCSACQRARFSARVFGCAGQFREVVQLQLTFGAMLLRLRNSALKLEHANQSKRQFLRFVFHEIRVPLNALSLGVEQLHDILTTGLEQQRQHSQHLLQQSALVSRVEEALQAGQLSELSRLVAELDHLRYGCALCSDTDSGGSGGLESSALSLLQIVQDQVATVTRILNDVLSFQRIEDGELKLELCPFQVQLMVDNTLHSFQAEFRQKGLQLHTHWIDCRQRRAGGGQTQQQSSADAAASLHEVRLDVAGDREGRAERSEGVAELSGAASDSSWWVCGDQYRLRQVLSNFVSNALKFTQAGSISVIGQLSSQPYSDPSKAPAAPQPSAAQDGDPSHCWLQLSVRDTGIGIPLQALRSLFQPYQQIRPGALQEGKGSGLGLSICKRIVELHRGQVIVSSLPGEGSTFAFEVPVELLKDDAVAAVVQQANDRQAADDAALESSRYSHLRDDSKRELDDAQSFIRRQLPEPSPSPSPAPWPPASPEPAAARPAAVPADPESAAASPPPIAASAPVSSPLVLDHASIAEAFGAPAAQRNHSDPTGSSVQEASWTASASGPGSSAASLASTASASSTASSALPVYSASARQPYRRLPATTSSSLYPVTPEERSRRALQVQQRGAGEAEAQDNQALRVLVVEDSAVNRKLLVMMCNGMGLRVQDAEDGLQAYQLIAAEVQGGSGADESRCPFDVVLLDDCMPRMSGVECVQALRALGLRIPIFGITANALIEDQQRFLRSGATAVVTKPMQKRQLVEMIATARHYRDSRDHERMQPRQQREQEADSQPPIAQLSRDAV